jgi:hypothetical protein
MRTASRPRVSTSILTVTVAALAAMSYSGGSGLMAHIEARPASSVAARDPLAAKPRSDAVEPVPVPVEIQRDYEIARNHASWPVRPDVPHVATQAVSTTDVSTAEVSTRGMGRSRDDYINAAAAISQHIVSLDIPVPREVVRVVALPPIDTRRLPEQPAAMSTADLSGLFDLAAQSMAALPVPQSTVSRARKHVVSISQGGIKRVAGFVKRSNVPAPTRIALPVPKRSLVANGTLRTHPLHTPVIKSASAAIVTSALMVLSGQ